jgi:hypothetical protein
MKFKSDIEVQAGLKDSSGAIGLSGQILSSTSGNVSWVTPTVNTVARDVQNEVKAGVAINKGQAVYVTGADGTNIIVGLASNVSEATSSKTLGLLNATVAINGMADVVQIGRLAGLNTIGATAGDPVWLGTNGNLIYGLINKPYAPAHLVFLGIVTRVNSNNGEIFVNVQNGFELKEIHDVDIITNVPINGDVLGYDGTLWVNKTIAQWLGYTPANASGTTNYVSKFTGATTLGNSQIFDNGTNVGIGTASPSAKLDVSGSAYIAGAITLPQNPTGTTYGNGVSASPPYMINQGAGDNDAIRFYSESAATNQVSMVFEINDDIETAGNEWIWRNKKTYGGYEATTPMLLSGAGAATFLSSVTAGAFLTNGASGAAGQEAIRINNDNGYIGFFNSANNTRSGYIQGNTTDLTITTSPSTPLIFGTANAEKMRILSNGNVGIGTTSPSEKLTINGGPLRLESATGVSSYVHYISPGNDEWSAGMNGAYDFQIAYSNGLGTPRMTLLKGGNVGIGTSSPSRKLSVIGLTYFSSDIFGGVNSGIFFSGDGSYGAGVYGGNSGLDLLLGAGGSEKMRINSSGNVGIGTTNPLYKFHVRTNTNGNIGFRNPSDFNSGWTTGSAFGVFNDADNANEKLYIETSQLGLNLTSQANTLIGGNVGIGTTSPSAFGGGGLTLGTSSLGKNLIINSSANGTNGLLQFVDLNGNNSLQIFGGSTEMNFYGYGNRPMSFYTNDAERMRIASSGNVGIGTTAPQAKLHINNGADRNLWFRVNGSGTGTELLSINDAQSTRQSLAFSASSFYFDSGNVGIGTTSPAWKLDVSGLGRFRDANTYEGAFIEGTNGVSYFGSLATDAISLYSSGVSRVYINSSGNVGIGTTNPLYKTVIQTPNQTFGLVVTSNANDSETGLYVQPDHTNGLVKLHASGGSDKSFGFLTGNTERLRITSTGNVGIGTTSPGHKLQVSGTAGTSWSTLLQSNSKSAVYSAHADGYGMAIETSQNTSAIYTFKVAGGDGTNIGTNEYFRITGTGSVGIGTSSPSQRLDVNGNLSIGDGANADQNISIRYGSSSGAYGAVRFTQSGTNNSTIHAFSTTWQGGTIYSSSTGAININGSTGVTFGAWNNIDVAFNTGGTSYFKNNVGIGTTSPSSNLTVVRDANNASYITTFSNTNAGTSANTISEWKVNGYSSFVIGKSNSDGRVEIAQIGNNNIDFINNGTNVMSIDTNQNVMVNGTTAEACAQLEIKSETKGFLPPRMSDADRDNISSPVEGLMIYNTTQKTINFYDGTTWQRVAVV